jgi:hypothetical protein
VRIRNRWFKGDSPKSPEQNASAMAFITWRVARNMLTRMRGAQFDIDAGAAYFAFMREVLVFLVQVGDRMACRSMDEATRTAFTTALVRRVADILDENEGDLLGLPTPGVPSHRDAFIDLVNELAGHYAEFGADPTEPGFMPDFGFMRYLAARVEPVLPEKDRRWAMDQLMAAEVPEAVGLLARGLDGLLSGEPRAAGRAMVSGD